MTLQLVKYLTIVMNCHEDQLEFTEANDKTGVTVPCTLDKTTTC